ncbi:hypothetical protein P691DRAFT_666793 [Macrolepiota fuliginosa MF-IS2]|uniref:DUF6699 domain-containing protein n=1 Tax=Macrolepiota fuliginosa MF-IS2 TaxID=1400762 RepID=A0A9P5XEB9_9AGAR|nr:hypothetical protein P691DRAFT_666793 [Macrolepiota fuliginosa MF-IS2]
MQKRVHFAPTNTMFSPVPNTPSPALSEVSLPSDSSSEVSTPPPEIDYPRAHYPHSPFPHNTDLLVPKSLPEPGQMQIHYLLAYSPLADIPINFDLSLHWSQIEGQISSHELSEPATSPPLPSLLIICPLVPGDILVRPREFPGPHVTVLDVLYYLYRYLRLAVSQEEYETQATGTTKAAVNSAYHARCGRVSGHQARATEEGKGVKKVDFLQGRNMFKGLSGTLTGAHVWELNVA